MDMMNDAMPRPLSRAEDLCFSCGMCCRGVIFADVQLSPRLDAAAVKALSDVLPRMRPGETLRQPCPAFDGCLCRIYSSRPRHCRKFECLLLMRTKQGQLDPAKALKVIGSSLRLVEKVLELLRTLGDTNEGVALSLRFRRMSRRIEAGRPDAQTAAVFAQLTLAFHKLTLKLGKEFYPSR